MKFNRAFVNVIGCGFAGIECALFLAGHGIKVHLFDSKRNGTYKSCDYKSDFSEKREINEVLLRQELSLLGSPLIKAERELLSQGISDDLPSRLLEIGREMVKHNENIEFFEASVNEVNPKEVTIIATGPKTDEGLYEYLLTNLGYMRCYNHMPIYPVLQKIDESNLISNGNDKEYLYLPLDYSSYIDFINHIVKGLNSEINDKNFVLKENTMEELVNRGKDNLKNYAMMPLLLNGVKERPYAVLKLRKTENGLRLEDICSKFDIVNQLEVFSSLEGFEKSIIKKKADMLDVCYLNSRYVINEFHQCHQNENLFFAGSILGIEGYVDCIASGIYTALNVNKYFNEKLMIPMPKNTCIGSLAKTVISVVGTRPQPFIEDYGVIQMAGGEDVDELVSKAYNRSVEALAKYKEDYKNGKSI